MHGWFYYHTTAHYNGPYPTREDAIAAGRAMTDPSLPFWIMEGKKPPFQFPTADQLLALFVEVNAGLGTVDDPFTLDDVAISDEQKQNLRIGVGDMFAGWLDQFRIDIPTFQTIQNIEEIQPAP